MGLRGLSNASCRDSASIDQLPWGNYPSAAKAEVISTPFLTHGVRQKWDSGGLQISAYLQRP
jgi:hypothetical protein